MVRIYRALIEAELTDHTGAALHERTEAERCDRAGRAAGSASRGTATPGSTTGQQRRAAFS